MLILTIEYLTGDAYVAYATDNGVVGVIKIRQTLESIPATSPFGLNLSIRVTIESSPFEICTPDQRPCTTLEWVEIKESVSFSIALSERFSGTTY
jgi:hypothetical protein